MDRLDSNEEKSSGTYSEEEEEERWNGLVRVFFLSKGFQPWWWRGLFLFLQRTCILCTDFRERESESGRDRRLDTVWCVDVVLVCSVNGVKGRTEGWIFRCGPHVHRTVSNTSLVGFGCVFRLERKSPYVETGFITTTGTGWKESERKLY